ncbi:MAG: SBBP repeat-containing protein, partial [Bryobacteraceae bacterium]
MLRLFAAILVAASVATAASASSHPRPRLWFEPNRGQAANDVLFLCRLPGASIELLRTGSRLNSSAGTIAMSWEDGAPSSVEPSHLLSTKINYLAGRGRARWITGVPSFESVTYLDLYPGIDQLFHLSADGLEYDFIVKPGADLAKIRLRVSGARRVSIDAAGDLAADRLIQRKPMIYQEIGGRRIEIAGRWVQRSADEFGFEAADYDHKSALTVDPVLLYSTYLQQNVATQALASGPAGDIYVAGSYWFDPPTYLHPGGYVAKLNADGTAYQYITYLSGSGYASISAIALDGAGNAYVSGTESSLDFPITGTGILGGIIAASPVAQKVFVAKIDPQGLPVYSDAIGGPVFTFGGAVAVTPQGEAIVSGLSNSTGFPVTAGAYQVKDSKDQSFLVKIDATGANVVFAATGIGGSALALDAEGNIYMAGTTYVTDYPTTPGAYQITFPQTVQPCESP